MNVGQTHLSSFIGKMVSEEPQVVYSDLRGEKCTARKLILGATESVSVPNTRYCGDNG